ncbi:MAG: hypothetical protein QM770_06125 [Tepidisphaeraceae bacterium]
MSERELRDKYGGKLPKAINRAMRAELPDGNAALDLLTSLAGPAMHSGWKKHDGTPTPEAADYFRQKKIVDALEAQIRKKYGISPGQSTGDQPARRRRK